MLKDEVLERLAQSGANVAQFVSYGPDETQRFVRIRGVESATALSTVEDAVMRIHRTQASPNVNIRTFLPDKPDGNPFFYGPKYGFGDPRKAAEKIREMCAKGYHVIVNETIDEADGGFSGVLFGDLFEFASRDIPRCVEKSGCAALPRALATKLIRAVYGFNFEIPYAPEFRVECSVHPGRVGYLGTQQIVWQTEHMFGALPSMPSVRWPNRYSRDMGDKTFGLLIAYLLGFSVPRTHVVGRYIPFFSFGTATGSGEFPWVRMCPFEQTPGKFTTKRGWLDPFHLMQTEDPEGTKISSILIQDGIRAEYSGAAITQRDETLRIEGICGYGDSFMVGERAPEEIPGYIQSAVRSLWEKLRHTLGNVRFEWVYDGKDPWIVQLHVGQSESFGNVIYPGNPDTFIEFDVSRGLEELRAVAAHAQQSGSGVTLRGNIGITSHFGDLLRRSRVPSRIENV